MLSLAWLFFWYFWLSSSVRRFLSLVLWLRCVAAIIIKQNLSESYIYRKLAVEFNITPCCSPCCLLLWVYFWLLLLFGFLHLYLLLKIRLFVYNVLLLFARLLVEYSWWFSPREHRGYSSIQRECPQFDVLPGFWYLSLSYLYISSSFLFYYYNYH